MRGDRTEEEKEERMEEVGSRKRKRRKQDAKIGADNERVTELEKRERESDTSVDGGEGNEEKKRLSR